MNFSSSPTEVHYNKAVSYIHTIWSDSHMSHFLTLELLFLILGIFCANMRSQNYEHLQYIPRDPIPHGQYFDMY